MIQQLTVSALAIAFAVNVLTSILKRWVYPKFGKFGVQVVAFALAALGAWYILYGQHIEKLSVIAAGAVALFSLSVAFYEVVLQHLPFFKVETPAVVAARASE